VGGSVNTNTTNALIFTNSTKPYNSDDGTKVSIYSEKYSNASYVTGCVKLNAPISFPASFVTYPATVCLGYDNVNSFQIVWESRTFNVAMSSSDYRIKENFRTTNNVLERLCSINIFDYQDKKLPELLNTNIEKRSYKMGFFAHELQELFPEYEGIVSGNKDEVEQDGSIKIQQISSFIFSNILMKSIQEQNAEVKQLKLDLQEQNEKINQLILTVQALQAEVQELKSK
jgi:hypothetical protein